MLHFQNFYVSCIINMIVFSFVHVFKSFNLYQKENPVPISVQTIIVVDFFHSEMSLLTACLMSFFLCIVLLYIICSYTVKNFSGEYNKLQFNFRVERGS